ncbi:adenine deaminase [Candidatus Bipolaricaulota bacterium]|nr:adenine deaminase [Candidatus Bipolaricaulota bacterium]
MKKSLTGYPDRLSLVSMLRGDEPADTVIKNGSLVNVLTDEVLDRDLAIKNGRIGAVSEELNEFVGNSTRVIDASGTYITPGFIDAHLHIESSMLAPASFSQLMASKGVTTVFYDPHEIANVSGLEGVRWMYEEMMRSPVNGYLTVPSCVPASSPELETTGAELGLEEINEALGWDGTAALGEMMNYPGVLNRDERTIEKLKLAREHGLPIEGHASGLMERKLDSYGSMGIDSDHEGISKEEGIERARKGFWTMIREGSGWADLTEVVRSLTETDLSPTRFCLVTDDRDPIDLIEEGGVDHVIRRGVQEGLDPLHAIRMATLNPATRFGLDNELGSISPGRRADINLVSDLHTMEIEDTLVGGKPVDDVDWPDPQPSGLTDTIEISREITPEIFILKDREKELAIRVHKRDIITEKLDLSEYGGDESSLNRCAVIERHRSTGNVGRGLVHGFGVEGGAMASTVAHDNHNMIVLGSDEENMATVARHLEEIGGGQAVAKGGEVVASVNLPIAGLMSSDSSREVANSLREVQEAVDELEPDLPKPMMILTSLALAVIPELRLTDRGLVDVNDQEIIG